MTYWAWILNGRGMAALSLSPLSPHQLERLRERHDVTLCQHSTGFLQFWEMHNRAGCGAASQQRWLWMRSWFWLNPSSCGFTVSRNALTTRNKQRHDKICYLPPNPIGQRSSFSEWTRLRLQLLEDLLKWTVVCSVSRWWSYWVVQRVL